MTATPAGWQSFASLLDTIAAAAGRPASAPEGGPPNPFVGPRSFRTGERLFGRSHETGELLDILISQRIVLLHSPSGAGKTSLVEAAIRPALERNKFTVLPTVRVNRPPDPGDDPAERFVLSTIRSLAPEGRPGSITAALPRAATADGAGATVLVIDQFEEILTTEAATEQGRQARALWFSQMGVLLEDRRLWALFCIREDYLAELEPFLDALPSRLRVRYRLDLLQTAAAAEAIRGPAEAVQVEFARVPDAARTLIDDLATVKVFRHGAWNEDDGRYVEPVQLQVVCQELWSELPWSTMRTGDGRYRISADLIQRHAGKVDDALERYYDRVMHRTARDAVDGAGRSVAALGLAAIAEERRLRTWIDTHLLSDAGMRRPVQIGSKEANELTDVTVEALEDAHLVRGDERYGSRWLELAHDRLAQPVRASNLRWFQEHLQPFQLQARVWQERGRDASLLLTMAGLERAEQWLATNAAPLDADEEAFLGASRERRAELLNTRARELAQRRRLQIAAAVATACAVLAIAAAVFAVTNWLSGIELSNDAIAGSLLDGANGALASGEVSRAARLAILANEFDQESTHSFSLAVASTLAKFSFQLVGEEIGERHAGRVWSIALDVEHDQVVTGSEDGRVAVSGLAGSRAWDTVLETGAPVRSVALNGDSTWLAAGLCENQAASGACGNSRILIYRQEAGVWIEDFALEASVSGVRVVAFSPANSHLLVSTGRDGMVRVWDLEIRAQVAFSVTDAIGGATAMAFSDDGRWLAVGLCKNRPDPQNCADETGRIALYDAGALPQLSPPRMIDDAPKSGITSVAFSASGNQLAAAGGDGTIVRWQLSGVSPEATAMPPGEVLTGHARTVTAVAFSPDEVRLVSSGWDNALRVWDVSGPARQIANFSTEVLYALDFLPDGSAVVGAGNLGRTTVWQVVDLDSRGGSVLYGSTGTIQDVAVTDDGWIVVASGREGRAEGGLYRWSLEDGDVLASTFSEPGTETVWALGVNAGGTCVASGDNQGVVSVWSVPDGNLLARSSPATSDASDEYVPGDLVRAVEFSPTSDYFVTGRWDGTVARWDIDCTSASPTLASSDLLPKRVRIGSVRALDFSADGELVALGGCVRAPATIAICDSPGYVVVKNESTGDVARLCCSGEDSAFVPYSIAFNPSRTALFAGTLNGSIRVWCDPTGAFSAQATLPEPSSTFRRHSRSVRSFSFNGDGSLLITSSDDGTALVWDLTGWECGRDLKEPVLIWPHTALADGAPVVRVSGWLDARTIYLGLGNGEIVRFTLDAAEMATNICTGIVGEPSDSYWQGYQLDEESLRWRIATMIGLRPDPSEICEEQRRRASPPD